MSSDLCSPFTCNICLMFNIQQLESASYLPEGKTLTCNGCQLVRYCSAQHQKLDWPIHRQFCQAIQKIKKDLNVTHPLYVAGIPRNRLDVEKAIIKLKYLLRSALCRSLEYHEEELSSFAPFCSLCFEFQNLSVLCNKCCSQSYCSEEHREWHKEEHDKVCDLLKIYYCPYKVQHMEADICLQSTSRINDLHTMNLSKCVEKAFGIQVPLNPCKSSCDYHMFSWAADFSCIMTICYAMDLLNFQKLNLSSFNIFILGASVEAILWFREIHCKLFFLQNPAIRKLELHFIGPEVAETSYDKLIFTFSGLQRFVKFNFYKGLFQDYCKCCKVKPTLIVAFNCGFSEFSQYYKTLPNITSLDCGQPQNSVVKDISSKDTWFGGLVEILQTLDTPVIFTSFTEQEAEFDFAALQNAAATKQSLKVQIDHIFKAFKNPYRDLRPLRQWYTCDKEEFYYRNGYIQAVCTKLERNT